MAEATRGNTSDSFEQFLAEFGPEFPPVYDPAVQQVLELAAEHQRTLDLTPNAPAEMRTRIIHDLDSRWPHMQRTIVVSGVVRAADYQIGSPANEEEGSPVPITPKVDEEGNCILRDYPIDTYALLSKGFQYEEVPFLVGDECIGQHYLLRLMFEGSLHVGNHDDTMIWASVPSIAKPDSVTIESAYGSVTYLRSRAQTYFPPIAERLGRIEALGDQVSTADRLLQLKEITIAYRDNTWRAKEMNILGRYIKYVVDVESDPAPMLVTVKRGTRLFEDPFNDFDQLITPDRTIIGNISGSEPELMVIPRINLLHRVPDTLPSPPAVPNIDAMHTLGVALSVRILGKQRGNDIDGMIYLHDVLGIQDTRQMLITSPESDESH